MKAGEKRTVTLEDLGAVAIEMWRSMPVGSVVWLNGELGSGKTTFVQALAEVAGAEMASSPTFSLVNEYECPSGLIFHADCYRLRAAEEARDLDFAGILATARLLLIEWPERAGHFAPPPDISLVFAHTDNPDVRQLERVL
jgi:tRNA threonylcarbamoyladenosine biosynthesis protein TsaE